MKTARKISIIFADERLKKAFDKLKEDNPTLYKFINRALDDLKQNPFCGIHIPKKLMPKIYIQKYGIDNL